jgi:DNA-binding CsgD family transcriptional regulator/streptogramin lyase
MDDMVDRIAKLQTLTRRQRQVLRLADQQLTHAEIAQRLYIVERTVVYHMVQIYGKLGISNLPSGPRRIELGKYCHALHLLEQEQEAAPHVPSTDLSLDSEPNQPALDSDEPSPGALAAIEAVEAVIDDKYSIVKWEPKSPQENEPPPRRSSVLLNTLWRQTNWILLFLMGLVIGSIGTMLLWEGQKGLTNGSADIPSWVPSAQLASSPARAGEPELLRTPPGSTPTTTYPVATTRVSACDESSRGTALASIDRFLRSEGVSLFTVENTANALLTNRIRTITIDSSGLWIGYFASGIQSHGGLGHYDKQTWVQCPLPTEVTGANINALVVDKAGRLWLATETAGIAMRDRDGWHTYTVTNTKNLRTNETFGLTIDEQNNIWVATWEGIAKFDGTEWTIPYTAQNKTIATNRVHAVAFDSTHGMWVGHVGGQLQAGGISYRTADNRWTHYTKGKELGGNDVSSIVVRPATPDAPESIWIATTDGGISKYEQGVWTIYQIADGLPSNTVRTLALDPVGRIWAATASGTAYFDDSRWILYHRLDTESIAFGVKCQGCPFDQDHVWTGTFKGITHSRLPRHDDSIDVVDVCFISNQRERICPPVIRTTDEVTAIYPIALAPGEQFRTEITIAPRAPYQIRQGDHLSNTDLDDFHLFGAYYKIPATEIVEAGVPYSFTSYDTPFRAPQLDTSVHEQTFTSTWRMWMHTRYVGPLIHLEFTVRQSSTSTK